MGCGNSSSINSVENKEKNTFVGQKVNPINQVQQIKPNNQKSNFKIQATPLQSNTNQYNINYSNTNTNQNTFKPNKNQNFSQVHKAKKKFEANYLGNKERKNILGNN